MTRPRRAMTPEDWKAVAPTFRPEEFTDPEKMCVAFIHWLVKVRQRAGVPLRVISSYRSPAHNVSVGGATQSAHMDVPCAAVDLAPRNNEERHRIVAAALAEGCQRVGVYPSGGIHLDLTHDTRPAPRLWVAVDS